MKYSALKGYKQCNLFQQESFEYCLEKRLTVRQGQTEGVDGDFDQGLTEEMIRRVWIFQSRAEETCRLDMEEKRSQGLLRFCPQQLEEWGWHDWDVKEYGRGKFGRGSRRLRWRVLDLIGFRVKTSGPSKITRGMRDEPWDR